MKSHTNTLNVGRLGPPRGSLLSLRDVSWILGLGATLAILCMIWARMPARLPASRIPLHRIPERVQDIIYAEHQGTIRSCLQCSLQHRLQACQPIYRGSSIVPIQDFRGSQPNSVAPADAGDQGPR